MYAYFLFLISISIGTLFDRNKFGQSLFIFTSVGMIVFSALRVGGTGLGDYNTYLWMYSQISDWRSVLNPDIHAELGFRLLSYIGNLLNFDAQFIIASMAFLSAIIVIYIVNKYSPYKILSLLIWFPYFLTMNMHTARTSVAAAFGFLFFIFLSDKKIVRSAISLTLSLSFHSSALVLILAILIKLNINTLLYLLIGLSLFFILVDPFSLLAFLFSLIGLDKYETFINIYINSSEYGYPMALYDPRIILSIGVSALIFSVRKHIQLHPGRVFFKLYLIGVFLLIAFSSVTVVAWRASYYFLITSVLVIPYLAEIYNSAIYQKYKIKRTATCLFLILYSLYSTPIILNSEPYVFIMSK